MNVLHGQPVSPGYAEGTALLFERPSQSDPCTGEDLIVAPRHVEGECRRLREAVDAAIEELEAIHGRIREQLGEAHAAIFAVQIGMLRDPQFIAGADRRIRSEGRRAEAAFEAAVRELSEQLSGTGDPTQRERTVDIRDVGSRVLRQLGGGYVGPTVSPTRPVVLVARELLPSDAVQFQRAELAAIVTESGGNTSHTAILARALGVPSVTGVAEACERIPSGTAVLVDGESGELTLGPSAEQRRQFADAQRRFEGLRSVALAGRREPCVTRDGLPITLRANVGRIEQLPQIHEYHLAGVGLLRTEYLFMHSVESPPVSQQIAAYRRIAAAARPGPLVIRTFDFSADKPPAFIRDRLPRQSDPTGCGLRFSLEERSILEAQIAAIVETAREADVRILLPMVHTSEELAATLEMVREIARRRDAPVPPVGVMVETPGAVCQLERMLRDASFLSVGTNDLARLMLQDTGHGACRQTAELAAAHPVVLGALRHIADAAQAAERPVAVCGEAAGHPEVACLLVGLGFRDLSMSPVRSPHVRYRLRSLELPHAEHIAERALHADSLKSVRQCLNTFRVGRRPDRTRPQNN